MNCPASTVADNDSSSCKFISGDCRTIRLVAHFFFGESINVPTQNFTAETVESLAVSPNNDTTVPPLDQGLARFGLPVSATGPRL